MKPVPPANLEIIAITCNSIVRCGTKQISPQFQIADGKDNMVVHVDKQDRLMVGWRHHTADNKSVVYWVRVPWENVCFVSYKPVEDAAAREQAA